MCLQPAFGSKHRASRQAALRTPPPGSDEEEVAEYISIAAFAWFKQNSGGNGKITKNYEATNDITQLYSSKIQKKKKKRKSTHKAQGTYIHICIPLTHVHTYTHTYLPTQPHKHKTRITVGTVSCRNRLPVKKPPSLSTLSAGS